MTCNCDTLSRPHTGSCATGKLERPRYFARQLVTHSDLTLDQDYFRQRLRLHNRMLHGWGVVCGLLVENSGKAWTVRIGPGYALGPQGDEIMIGETVCFDVRRKGQSDADGEDPFCSDVQQQQPTELYVAIKYKQVMARAVRVQPSGCNCSDESCEYSRWVDCWELGTLPDCLPEQDPRTLARSQREQLAAANAIPTCKPCPESPWVVLAKVTFDDDGAVKEVDNCACRRMVRSFADDWWACKEAAQPRPVPDPADRLPQQPPEKKLEPDAGPDKFSDSGERPGLLRRLWGPTGE